jgi:hypothetical protein
VAASLPDRIRHAILATAATGAVLAIGALLLGGARAASSVALGAALATGNLYLLARMVQRRASAGRPRQGIPFSIPFKMAALIFAAFLILKFGLADPLLFVAGCAALPIGLVLGSLASDRLLPPEE